MRVLLSFKSQNFNVKTFRNVVHARFACILGNVFTKFNLKIHIFFKFRDPYATTAIPQN